MTDDEFVAWLKLPDTIRLVLVEVAVTVGGVDATYYLSSAPFVSKSTDTPATTPYAHCITGGVAFSEKLTVDGTPSISYGDIEIENRGGVRDAWLGSTYIWVNRSIQVYMGDPRWARADFRKIFDGVVGDIDASDAETLSLHLLDKLQRLNAPISENLLGGATDNKDKLIPLCFGEVFNVAPLLTNPATLQYQVHDGRIEDIIEVRSNGYVPVTITKSVSSGKFTLSANPASTVITCSVQGSRHGSPLTYDNTIVPIVENIVKNYGPSSSLLVDADLDLTQLGVFDAAYAQKVGLYVTERMNKLEACQQIAGSVGAQVVMTTLGQLRLVPLTLTGLGTPVDVTDEDMEQKSLHISWRSTVKASCKLAYCKNWNPIQTPAAALPAKSGANLKQEWWYITSTDATVQSNYLLDAQPQAEETLLLVDTEATTEAARRRDLWKTPRHVYTATYFAHMLLTELGDAIRITHDRFGLDAGVTGIALEIERDWMGGRVTIGVLA
jgi:uncharacterized protein YqjF (DUF2071 family)